jgi:uncharacterized Tic20 family protein
MSTPPPISYPQPAPMTPEDQRLWSTLVHIGGIVIGFWSSLIGYLVLKDRGGFIRAHTVSALNFNLTVLIGELIGLVLCFVFIGFLVLPAIYVLRIIFSIIAAMEANNGRPYKYPIAIEFIR